MEVWIFFMILIVMFLAYAASKLLSLRKKRATQKALAREKRKERRKRAYQRKLIKEKDGFEKKSVEQKQIANNPREYMSSELPLLCI